MKRTRHNRNAMTDEQMQEIYLWWNNNGCPSLVETGKHFNTCDTTVSKAISTVFNKQQDPEARTKEIERRTVVVTLQSKMNLK